MFETFFNEMLDTITEGFSNSQKSFLRYALYTVYEEKTKQLFDALQECEKNESHIETASLAHLKDEIRLQFLLTPLHTTKTREEITAIIERQARFKERWKALAQSKGIE
jgi:hypothetical protein